MKRKKLLNYSSTSPIPTNLMKTIIIFLFLVLSTWAAHLNNKRAKYEHRVEWETSNIEHKDCWWRCTEAGGFSCGFGSEGRNTSEFYICVETEQQCSDWLDHFYICPVAHCIPWRYSNQNKKVIYC